MSMYDTSKMHSGAAQEVVPRLPLMRAINCLGAGQDTEPQLRLQHSRVPGDAGVLPGAASAGLAQLSVS